MIPNAGPARPNCRWLDPSLRGWRSCVAAIPDVPLSHQQGGRPGCPEFEGGVPSARIRRLAALWNVSQAEVIRRAVFLAESPAARPDPAEPLQKLLASGEGVDGGRRQGRHGGSPGQPETLAAVMICLDTNYLILGLVAGIAESARCPPVSRPANLS